MSSKLEPVIWLRDTGHIGIHEGVDGLTYVRTFMAKNQIFSHRWVTIFSRAWAACERRQNFQLFKRSPSGFNNVFRPKNYTTGFGKDKAQADHSMCSW